MIDHVVEGLTCDGDAQVCHRGEVGRAQPAWMMDLCEKSPPSVDRMLLATDAHGAWSVRSCPFSKRPG